jgi:hypothetical protein
MLKSIYHCTVLLAISLTYSSHVWALTNIDIVTESGYADYPTRYRLSYTIETKLREEDRSRLEQFLSVPLTKSGLDENEIAALKNNVIDALIKQEDGPQDLLPRLEADWADLSQGLLWRSYIVQKIPELTLKLKTESEVKAALAFLRRLIKDEEPEFYATAIMGVDRLNNIRPDLFSSQEVGRVVATRMNQINTPDLARISLLQVWARHDALLAVREARNILQNERALVLLKMSALAVLGTYGKEEDKDLIENYLISPEGRLSTAAESALTTQLKRFNKILYKK